MRPAIFLDRDGVIIENREAYVRSWQDVAFIPGALDALQGMAATSYAIVIVTNQSGVGRGMLSLETATALNARVVAEIVRAGGRVDGLYLCPHTPEDGCDCRKPRPGMLLQAARELGLDLTRSWMVGDALSDLQAGQAAGAQSVLVLTGRGGMQEIDGQFDKLPDLPAALEYIRRRS
nr:D-glycero-beta-D-manno-heptose 1,7-bisphosphate 7-phosphatase [Chloroflexota bacterium]